MNFETAFEQTKTKKYLEGYHNYYSTVIGGENITSVLEIGVKDGASLYSWKKIWPSATIEGIDIVEPTHSVRKNFKVFAQDSTNVNSASLIVNKYDLIVDDGDQNWSCKLRTFLNYYEKANKFYVIENIKGVHSLKKLFAKIPQLYLTEHFIFKSTGPKKTFSFRESGERIIEENSSFYIIFIKVHNFTKQFINKDFYSEDLLDIKRSEENLNKEALNECYDLCVEYLNNVHTKNKVLERSKHAQYLRFLREEKLKRLL